MSADRTSHHHARRQQIDAERHCSCQLSLWKDQLVAAQTACEIASVHYQAADFKSANFEQLLSVISRSSKILHDRVQSFEIIPASPIPAIVDNPTAAARSVPAVASARFQLDSYMTQLTARVEGVITTAKLGMYIRDFAHLEVLSADKAWGQALALVQELKFKIEAEEKRLRTLQRGVKIEEDCQDQKEHDQGYLEDR